MKVPISWLRDYVDVELGPEALAERLTLLGMEVQSIDARGAEWRNVGVGELLAGESVGLMAVPVDLSWVRVRGTPVGVADGGLDVSRSRSGDLVHLRGGGGSAGAW